MKPRIEWNLKGFVALRNSPGVVADLERRGQAIASAAGEGFVATPARTNTSMKGRARVSVRTETIEARIAEATDRSLMNSIDAGR